MNIFIKLLALSVLLSGCAGAYNTKDSRKNARNAENQANKNISTHVSDVAAKAATDAASIPTDVRPYTTP